MRGREGALRAPRGRERALTCDTPRSPAPTHHSAQLSFIAVTSVTLLLPPSPLQTVPVPGLPSFLTLAGTALHLSTLSTVASSGGALLDSSGPHNHCQRLYRFTYLMAELPSPRTLFPESQSWNS